MTSNTQTRAMLAQMEEGIDRGYGDKCIADKLGLTIACVKGYREIYARSVEAAKAEPRELS